METVRERHTLRTWTQPEMRWGVPASLVRALPCQASFRGLALLLVRAGAGRLRPRTPSQFPPASAAPFDPPARPAVDERAPGRFQHATFHNARWRNARGRTRRSRAGSESFIIGYCALSGRRYMVLSIRKERRHRTRRLYARLNSLYCRLPGFDVRAASARVTHTAPPQCIPPSNADAALDSSSI